MQELDAIVQRTLELLAIESPTGRERAIADRVERIAREIAVPCVVRDGDSLLVAPQAAPTGGELVLLLGHLDTVPELSPNPPRREADRVFGLGASDMKGALAVMLQLLARAASRPSRRQTAFVFYAGEEGSFAGSGLPGLRDEARAWFDAAKLAVCMEPTDNHVELGCLGTLHATFAFSGRRAHSARPWEGDNAIHRAAGLLQRLRDWQPRRHRFAGLEFVEVVSATTAAFRGARNVIPDRFELNVNFRFAPGREPGDVRADLAALAQEEATWEITDWCPAGRVCADNLLLEELLASSGAGPRSKQAWTDVGRLSEWGIDAINFGPGAPAQAHQAGEWIAIDALRRSFELLAGWL